MKAKSIMYTGIVIILLLLIIGTFAFISNSKNKRSFNDEKLQYESILSQKLKVSQELDSLKSNLAALTTKSQSEVKTISELNSKLSETESRIASLRKENTTILTKDKNELAELQKSKNELDQVYEDLKLKHETATSRIKELESSIILLDAQKKEVTANLISSEKYRTDNFEIYGSRGNKKDKLSIRARWTKKLNLSFDVPQSLTEAISFKITLPSGTIITPEDKSLAWLVEPASANLTVSLSPMPGVFDAIRKVNLSYVSKEKLLPGEYQIQIFSNDKNIGNCRIKLK